MRGPATPRRTDSRPAGATPTAGPSRTANGWRCRRTCRGDAPSVMPGLVPGIQRLTSRHVQDVDGRDDPGHDGKSDAPATGTHQLSNMITLRSVLPAFMLAK